MVCVCLGGGGDFYSVRYNAGRSDHVEVEDKKACMYCGIFIMSLPVFVKAMSSLLYNRA